MEIQSNTPTVFKLLAVVINVVVIAIVLLFRNKDADHESQPTAQNQEPPE